MAQLFAGMYASASGALMLDLTNAQGVRLGTNEHGYADFEALYPCGLAESFRIYDRPGLPYLSVVGNGATAWEGRVEDVAIVNGGVRIKAFGYQRALSDAPYTSLWSDTKTNLWRAWTSDDVSTRNPDLYTQDTNNRLYAGLKKGASYATGVDVSSLVYYAPDSTANPITYFSASYSYNLPTGWYFGVLTRNSALAISASTWITTTGGASSGSVSLSVAASLSSAIAEFYVANQAGSTYTESASESGAYYAKLTGHRVTVSGTSCTVSTIVSALLSYFSGLPNSSAVFVSSNGLDLKNEVYQDTTGAEILTRLAALGDTSGNKWEWGVYDGGLLHYRQRGSAGRAWYVDATELEIERTIQSLTNSMYAKYSDANGRTLRTAASTASDSAARYGLTRAGYVEADTTSATQAGYIRDVALTDGKDPAPRIALDFTALYDATGARWPLWVCRSGDTITIRNLPPSVSSAIDRIRTFRVSETNYDAMRDRLRVTPELPTPTLDVLIAQRAL